MNTKCSFGLKIWLDDSGEYLVKRNEIWPFI